MKHIHDGNALIAINGGLAAGRYYLVMERGLARILERPLENEVAHPCITTARMHPQHPAHGLENKDEPVLRNKFMPHPLPGSTCAHAREGAL